MHEKKVSVCFVIRNGLLQGYPFWESLSSALPFADEIVISEGFSTDDTYKYIMKFAEMHGDKVRVFRDDWKRHKSGCGEVITKISNIAMSRCDAEWIYYLQADEVIHEENAPFVRNIATYHSHEFNAVSFPFYHFIDSWKPLEKGRAYDEAIRMVKNDKAISLIGDGWNFGGAIQPICPAGLSPKPIYHLGWVFPENCDVKRIEHGKIYRDMPGYQETAKRAENNIASLASYKPLEIPSDFDDYPLIMKRLVGTVKYQLPKEIENAI